MDEDQKINMSLDDIIMYERMKNQNETDSLTSRKSGFRAKGAWKRRIPNKQNAAEDANSIQNLHYSRRGPLARRNYKRYGLYNHSPAKNALMQYRRNRVRQATLFLNRSQKMQHRVLQKPFSNGFIRNRLLALKRLQDLRTTYKFKMAARPRTRRDSDTLSVIIPNDMALRQPSFGGSARSAGTKRINSQLTVKNMRKFNAQCGGNQSWTDSIYSAGIRSKRSRSASVGRHSRAESPARNYAGSHGGWNSRPGTPANSEASGYSIKNFHSRLLNYGLQRSIAMLQGRTIPVDTRGRPTIIRNGLGVEYLSTPVATSMTFHERFAVMLQSF